MAERRLVDDALDRLARNQRAVRVVEREVRRRPVVSGPAVADMLVAVIRELDALAVDVEYAQTFDPPEPPSGAGH